MENLESLLASIKKLDEKHKDQILFLSSAASEIRDLEELVCFGKELLKEDDYDPIFYLLDDKDFIEFKKKEELSKSTSFSDGSSSFFPIIGNNMIYAEIRYPTNPYNLLGIIKVAKENIEDNEKLYLSHFSRRFGNILHRLILEQKYKEKDFFMQEINRMFTHDVSNSLTGIIYYNQIVSKRMQKIPESSEKEAVLDYAKMISDNGERITELLGLINLASIHEDEINEEMPYYIRHKFINKISSMIGKRYDSNIIFSLDKNLVDAKISMNRALLSSSIENLFGNSIKYTPQGGKIVLHVYLDDGFLVYDNINDLSQAIPFEHIENLKLKGNRLGLPQLPNSYGLNQGMGLYMTNKFTKLSNGSLSFESGENYSLKNILSDQNEVFNFGFDNKTSLDRYFLSRMKILSSKINLDFS